MSAGSIPAPGTIPRPGPADYRRRREALLEAAGGGLILVGASESSPDTEAWDRSLFYLTGCSDRDALLLLAPRGLRLGWWESRSGPLVGRGTLVHEALFMRRRSAIEVSLSGKIPEDDESGIATILGLSELEGILPDALMSAEDLWVNLPATPSLDDPPSPHSAWLAGLQARFPWLRLRNIAPSIHELRRRKDPVEPDLIRRAFELHAPIFEKLMLELYPERHLRPLRSQRGSDRGGRPRAHRRRTLLPHLAIPEEGSAIRIEDGLVVTDTGAELLAGPPRDAAGIEELLAGRSWGGQERVSALRPLKRCQDDE